MASEQSKNQSLICRAQAWSRLCLQWSVPLIKHRCCHAKQLKLTLDWFWHELMVSCLSSRLGCLQAIIPLEPSPPDAGRLWQDGGNGFDFAFFMTKALNCGLCRGPPGTLSTSWQFLGLQTWEDPSFSVYRSSTSCQKPSSYRNNMHCILGVWCWYLLPRGI